MCVYIYIYIPPPSLPNLYTVALVQLTVGLNGVFCIIFFIKPMIVSGFGCKITIPIFYLCVLSGGHY